MLKQKDCKFKSFLGYTETNKQNKNQRNKNLWKQTNKNQRNKNLWISE
jgi:hypothetical protein